MTIGQMQEVANAVTQYYRNAGFILAQAFIPAQEVSANTVTIEVI
jgi:hemolysin activation/secretion protein